MSFRLKILFERVADFFCSHHVSLRFDYIRFLLVATLCKSAYASPIYFCGGSQFFTFHCSLLPFRDKVTLLLFDIVVEMTHLGMLGEPRIDAFVGDGLPVVERLIDTLGERIVMIGVHR